jgi:hypothetical protein
VPVWELCASCCYQSPTRAAAQTGKGSSTLGAARRAAAGHVRTRRHIVRRSISRFRVGADHGRADSLGGRSCWQPADGGSLLEVIAEPGDLASGAASWRGGGAPVLPSASSSPGAFSSAAACSKSSSDGRRLRLGQGSALSRELDTAARCSPPIRGTGTQQDNPGPNDPTRPSPRQCGAGRGAISRPK